MPRKVRGRLGHGCHPGVRSIRAGVTAFLERLLYVLYLLPVCANLLLSALRPQGDTAEGMTLLRLSSWTAGRGQWASSPLFKAPQCAPPFEARPGGQVGGALGLGSEPGRVLRGRGVMPAGGNTGSECRLQGEECTAVRQHCVHGLRARGWLVRGPGLHPASA